MAHRPGKLPPNHREWLGGMEEQTMARGPSGVRAARITFNQLPRAKQLELLEELIELRSADLCRAYRNLVDVSIGYKRKTDKRTGRPLIGRVPCITFLVRRKWTAAQKGDPRRQLPAHLFMYTMIDRKRMLCAVTTDVIDGRNYAKVGPQAKQIVVRPERRPQSPGATGVIACAVKRSKNGTDLFGLSCRHVFGISNSQGSSFFFGEVTVRDSGAIVGTTVGLRGVLRNKLHFSLDAQACVVEGSSAALWEALGNVKLSGYAQNNGQVPDTYWIHVANRAPVKARRVAPVPRVNFGLHYKNIGMVVHDQVIEGQAVTKPGDSGAPCTTRSNGGLLLGMHFAGPVSPANRPPRRGPVFMIPSWHLLDRSRYQGGGADKLWQLVGER